MVFDYHLMADRLLMRCNFIVSLLQGAGGHMPASDLYDQIYVEGEILFRAKQSKYQDDRIFRDCLSHLIYLNAASIEWRNGILFVKANPNALDIIDNAEKQEKNQYRKTVARMFG
jgi:hypothetical protein